MTKIKICGITSKEDAQYVSSVNADFAGFVLFFPKSRRNITIEKAKEIFNYLNKDIKKVAVVVSPSVSQIEEINNAGFDYIQIHSHISEDVLNSTKLPILKAFNISDMNEYEFYHSCKKIIGYVFDAQVPGSGKTFDWSLIKDIPRDEKLLILAGGLNPQNVRSAINAVHPDGVDVSSGVERTDGFGKDPEKIKAFAENVLQ
jgi:phosphoribosylanthranilate isomerase